jgi:dienelactone hydrolase
VPFPIVIFSHGHGTCNQNSSTAQCEELASHGYVVVSINHTHGSIITEFSDGRTVGIQSAKKNDTGTNFTQKKEFLDSVLEVWISDIQFVLDQLKNITQDKESCFYGRLDMKNIGMFGHSLGGATAAQVCRRDNRVKAGVDLDGGLFGPTPAANFNKPFMFLINPGMFKNVDQPLPEEIRRDFKITSHGEEDAFKYVTCFSIEQLIKVLGPDAYTFVIKGMGHLDFTDIGLFKNSSFFFKFFRNLGSKSIIGSIDGFRATEIVNAYLVNFFDKYLKAQQSELLDGGGKQYPEVEMKLCHKL